MYRHAVIQACTCAYKYTYINALEGYKGTQQRSYPDLHGAVHVVAQLLPLELSQCLSCMVAIHVAILAGQVHEQVLSTSALLKRDELQICAVPVSQRAKLEVIITTLACVGRMQRECKKCYNIHNSQKENWAWAARSTCTTCQRLSLF